MTRKGRLHSSLPNAGSLHGSPLLVAPQARSPAITWQTNATRSTQPKKEKGPGGFPPGPIKSAITYFPAEQYHWPQGLDF